MLIMLLEIEFKRIMQQKNDYNLQLRMQFMFPSVIFFNFALYLIRWVMRKIDIATGGKKNYKSISIIGICPVVFYGKIIITTCGLPS